MPNLPYLFQGLEDEANDVIKYLDKYNGWGVHDAYGVFHVKTVNVDIPIRLVIYAANVQGQLWRAMYGLKQDNDRWSVYQALYSKISEFLCVYRDTIEINKPFKL